MSVFIGDETLALCFSFLNTRVLISRLRIVNKHWCLLSYQPIAWKSSSICLVDDISPINKKLDGLQILEFNSMQPIKDELKIVFPSSLTSLNIWVGFKDQGRIYKASVGNLCRLQSLRFTRVTAQHDICTLGNITNLSLITCGLQDDFLIQLCMTLSKLKSLDVSGNHNITSTSVPSIFGLAELESLNVNDTGISWTFDQNHLSFSITVLNANYLNNLRDLLHSCPNTNRLVTCYWNEAKLNKIDIARVTDISAIALDHVDMITTIIPSVQLKKFQLSQTDISFQIFELLTTLPALECLQIASCNNLDTSAKKIPNEAIVQCLIRFSVLHTYEVYSKELRYAWADILLSRTEKNFLPKLKSLSCFIDDNRRNSCKMYCSTNDISCVFFQ